MFPKLPDTASYKDRFPLNEVSLWDKCYRIKRKDKVVPLLFLTEEYGMKAFLTSVLDEDESSASRPSRFNPRALGTHWIGGWVGPSAGLDAVEKRKIPQTLPGLEAPIIQPVAQRYTDWAIRAPNITVFVLLCCVCLQLVKSKTLKYFRSCKRKF
jgi:hypothetical protein